MYLEQCWQFGIPLICSVLTESHIWERVDFPKGVFSSRTRHCTALILPLGQGDSEKETTRSVSLPVLQRRSRQGAGVHERPSTSPAGYSRPPQSSNTVVFNNKIYPNDSSSTSSSLSSTPNEVKAVREIGSGCSEFSDRTEAMELSTFSSESNFVVFNDKEALLSTVRTLCDDETGAENPTYVASPGVTGDFKVFDSSASEMPETRSVPIGNLVDISIPTDCSVVNRRNKLQMSAKTQRQQSEVAVERRSFSADDLVLEDLEQGVALSELFEQDELFFCNSKLSQSATISGKLSQMSNACQAISGKLSNMSGGRKPVDVNLNRTPEPATDKLSQSSAEAKQQASQEVRKDDHIAKRLSSVFAETRQSSRSHDNPILRSASDACQVTIVLLKTKFSLSHIVVYL